MEYGNHLPERIAPDVMADIQPYRSMITGEMITSRSRHREHLKDHGYVELGNDTSLKATYKGMPDTSPQKRKELIRAQVDAMTHEQFRRAGKKDFDNLKWNSRKD